MKLLKKFAAIGLAALTLATCLVSCGSSTNYAASNTEYFIGATGPLTGDVSAYGIAVKNGAQIAIDEINANGGLNGVKFKFDIKDDQAGEEAAATGYTALYEAGMQLSLGSVTSGSCKAFADYAKDDGVLSLTPSGSEEAILAISDLTFRVCFGDAQQGTISADTLTQTYTKIGAIYDDSTSYSVGIFDAFDAQMKKLGKVEDTDYVVRTFNKDNNKDFSTQVAALSDAGCDVIYLPIYYQEAALIAKAAAAIDYNVPIFGNDGLDSIAGQLEGSNVTASIVYTAPFDVNAADEKVTNFVKVYEERFGEVPNQFAADGYDAVMILFAAMQKAGVNDVTMSAKDMGALVKDVLHSAEFSYSGLTGNNMTWAADGSCNKEACIVKVQ